MRGHGEPCWTAVYVADLALSIVLRDAAMYVADLVLCIVLSYLPLLACLRNCVHQWHRQLRIGCFTDSSNTDERANGRGWGVAEWHISLELRH